MAIDNKNKWFGDASISDRLFMPVLKDILSVLIEKNRIESSRAFSIEHNHSYMQVYKYKHWLVSKGIVELVKDGRSEALIPTKKGESLLECMSELLKIIKKEKL